MTAQIVELPTVDPLEEAKRRLQEAMDAFAATAYTVGVPRAVVNALRSPEAVTAEITVHGEPVTLMTGHGAMTDTQVADTWERMLAASPAAGSRVHTAGGRVLVDLPDTIGGAE